MRAHTWWMAAVAVAALTGGGCGGAKSGLSAEADLDDDPEGPGGGSAGEGGTRPCGRGLPCDPTNLGRQTCETLGLQAGELHEAAAVERQLGSAAARPAPAPAPARRSPCRRPPPLSSAAARVLPTAGSSAPACSAVNQVGRTTAARTRTAARTTTQTVAVGPAAVEGLHRFQRCRNASGEASCVTRWSHCSR